MKLLLRTYRTGTPRQPSEGLRIGTVRYPPRGVPVKDRARLDHFDVWLPTLAPSRDLLAAYREGMTAAQFFRRYRREMAETDPRQTIALLAALARHTPLAIGCFCEDETRCHRSQLIQLIRNAAQANV